MLEVPSTEAVVIPEVCPAPMLVHLGETPLLAVRLYEKASRVCTPQHAPPIDSKPNVPRMVSRVLQLASLRYACPLQE